jgi:primosomal protein N' (replication factor Y) (superfamily II helicase)
VRVLVQFGKRKNYSALVIALTHIAPEGFEIKPILSVLDDNAVIHPVNLGLWNWMADYYMSPLGEVMNAAMPSALKLQGSDGLVEEKYKEKTKTTIGIRPDLRASETWETVLDSLSKAPKQKDLLYHFVEMSGMFSGKNKTTIDKQQLLKGSGIGEGVLNQLVDKGFLTIHKEVVSRVDTPQAEQADMNLLNNWQQEAIDQIREQFLQKQVVLIHGVTASGKTEIYIHLIDEAAGRGNRFYIWCPKLHSRRRLLSG